MFLVAVMGECKCLLSVSDDIVYLFTYQEWLIYLFSQHQVHPNPVLELYTLEHITCITAKKVKDTLKNKFGFVCHKVFLLHTLNHFRKFLQSSDICFWKAKRVLDL